MSSNMNPDPLARLRDSVKATLAAIARVVDAVSAVHAAYDKTDSEKKSAEAAIQSWYSTGKPAPKPEPKKPAKKPEPKKPAPKPEPKKPAKKPEPAAVSPATGRLPGSVTLTPKELALNIGAYAVKELAEVDARDFLSNPRILFYRSVQFPAPERYRVNPHVEAAKVVKRTSGKFSEAPWTVHVTFGLSGAEEDCRRWGMGVYARNKAEQE